MNGTLFRNEVLATRKSDGLGTIRIAPPRIGWIFFAGACVVLLLISCIAVFGRYSRTEKMTGRLVPKSGESAVMSPELTGASISEVYVAEGDIVKRGQALFKIANQRSSAVLGDTGALISTQLDGKLTQLKASADSQERLATLKSEDLKRRIPLIKARIAKLELQIADQDQRTKSAEELYETWRTKAVGVISGYQISQQLDAMLQQRSLSQDIRNQRLQAMSELNSSQAELEQIPLVTRDKIAALTVQIADVESAKAENEQSRDLIIRAPTGGVVSGLLAHAGQPVESNTPLMSVLPKNASLVAELWVPSQAIGLLRVGEDVEVSYEAFPAKQYGFHRGSIESISTSALLIGQ